jgi:hypothetical protein
VKTVLQMRRKWHQHRHSFALYVYLDFPGCQCRKNAATSEWLLAWRVAPQRKSARLRRCYSRYHRQRLSSRIQAGMARKMGAIFISPNVHLGTRCPTPRAGHLPRPGESNTGFWRAVEVQTAESFHWGNVPVRHPWPMGLSDCTAIHVYPSL